MIICTDVTDLKVHQGFIGRLLPALEVAFSECPLRRSDVATLPVVHVQVIPGLLNFISLLCTRAHCEWHNVTVGVDAHRLQDVIRPGVHRT